MTRMENSKGTKTKKRPDFLKCMDELLRNLPQINSKDQKIKEIHAVLDNYFTHKGCDEWLSAHLNVKHDGDIFFHTFNGNIKGIEFQ